MKRTAITTLLIYGTICFIGSIVLSYSTLGLDAFAYNPIFAILAESAKMGILTIILSVNGLASYGTAGVLIRSRK